ncbi:MAG: AI-2E family transporter [Thiohalocapsa sp.]
MSGWPIAAAFAAVIFLFYEIRYAVLPFVLAVALSFIVEPVVAWLTPRVGRRRWLAALFVFLGLLALLAAIAYWIGTAAVAELFSFVQNVPTIVHNLMLRLMGPRGVSVFGQTYTPDSVVRLMSGWAQSAIGFGVAAKAASYGIAALLGGVLTIVLLAYFLISGPQLAAGAIWLVPPERRGAVERLLPQLVPALRRYLLGVAAVVTYTALLAWIAFGPVFHLPNALVLAIAVGFLEIIPVVGPGASAALVGATALQQHTLLAMLALIGVVIFLRVTVDNLIGPLVLGSAARLHPVVVIFAFLVGAMLFGIVGLILAVPTAVCIKVALTHYYADPIRGQDDGLAARTAAALPEQPHAGAGCGDHFHL